MDERENMKGAATTDAATEAGSERGDDVEARADDLLTPGEVARLFGVDPKTVTRWAAAGKLEALRTLGGHRRYRANEVHGLLERQSGRGSQPGSTGSDGAASNGSGVLGRHEA